MRFKTYLLNEVKIKSGEDDWIFVQLKTKDELLLSKLGEFDISPNIEIQYICDEKTFKRYDLPRLIDINIDDSKNFAIVKINNKYYKIIYKNIIRHFDRRSRKAQKGSVDAAPVHELSTMFILEAVLSNRKYSFEMIYNKIIKSNIAFKYLMNYDLYSAAEYTVKTFQKSKIFSLTKGKKYTFEKDNTPGMNKTLLAIASSLSEKSIRGDSWNTADIWLFDKSIKTNISFSSYNEFMTWFNGNVEDGNILPISLKNYRKGECIMLPKSSTEVKGSIKGIKRIDIKFGQLPDIEFFSDPKDQVKLYFIWYNHFVNEKYINLKPKGYQLGGLETEKVSFKSQPGFLNMMRILANKGKNFYTALTGCKVAGAKTINQDDLKNKQLFNKYKTIIIKRANSVSVAKMTKNADIAWNGEDFKSVTFENSNDAQKGNIIIVGSMLDFLLSVPDKELMILGNNAWHVQEFIKGKYIYLS